MSKTTIDSLQVCHFPEIISILDTQLGTGYIKESKLFEYVESDIKGGFTAITNGKVSGVLLTKTLVEWDNLKNTLLKNTDWFKGQLSSTLPVGIIDIIGVNPIFTGHGIGSLLVEKSVKKLNEKCNAIVSFVWEHPDGTPLARILEKNGFNLGITIPKYWDNDSVKQNYGCKYCGNPPCLCNALIYVK